MKRTIADDDDRSSNYFFDDTSCHGSTARLHEPDADIIATAAGPAAASLEEHLIPQVEQLDQQLPTREDPPRPGPSGLTKPALSIYRSTDSVTRHLTANNDLAPISDVVIVGSRTDSSSLGGMPRHGSIIASPLYGGDDDSSGGWSQQFHQSTHRFFDAGWHFAPPANYQFEHSEEMISSMMGEVRQDPPGLHIRKVDVNARLDSIANDQFPKTSGMVFFWMHKGTYILVAFLCCSAYLLIPCRVPTDFTQFVFLNRLIFNTIAALTMILLGLLLLRERKRWGSADAAAIGALVVAYNTQDIAKLYLLSHQWWFDDYVQVFNGLNWIIGMGLYFYWLRMEHPTIPLWSKVTVYYSATVAVLFAYLCLLEIFTMKFQYLSSLGNVVQALTFVGFFMWTNLCVRALQMLTRRIHCVIARLENRHVTWHDLLRAQLFVFFAHCAQLSYYRLLFINVDDWYMEGVLIAVHVVQETLLYPVRLLERVRGFERQVMANLPGFLRFVAYPVLPLSVWMDLHCADYFLRKVAEIATLVVFVAQLLVFRNGYMQECFTAATFTAERYQSLFYLCGVLLLVEVVSGLLVVHRVVYGEIRRGFLFHHIVRPRINRLFLAIVIVCTNCSSTFADALRHVKF